MNVIFSMGISYQGIRLAQDLTVVAESITPTSVSIATGQTAFHVVRGIDVSHLKALLWVSDQALTIKVNDSGAPEQTITLPANTPFGWVAGAGVTCPINQDVTDLYIANASGATATLQMWDAQDITP